MCFPSASFLSDSLYDLILTYTFYGHMKYAHHGMGGSDWLFIHAYAACNNIINLSPLLSLPV